MSSPLQPFEYSLAPRVDQAKQENEDEDGHFDKTKGAVCLEPGCPWEDEYSFNVEHYEEQRKDVVPDIGLAPIGADRIYTRFIVNVLLRLRARRTKQ